MWVWENESIAFRKRKVAAKQRYGAGGAGVGPGKALEGGSAGFPPLTQGLPSWREGCSGGGPGGSVQRRLFQGLAAFPSPHWGSTVISVEETLRLTQLCPH